MEDLGHRLQINLNMRMIPEIGRYKFDAAPNMDGRILGARAAGLALPLDIARIMHQGGQDNMVHIIDAESGPGRRDTMDQSYGGQQNFHGMKNIMIGGIAAPIAGKAAGKQPQNILIGAVDRFEVYLGVDRKGNAADFRHDGIGIIHIDQSVQIWDIFLHVDLFLFIASCARIQISEGALKKSPL
jgi:hypothetical protein